MKRGLKLNVCVFLALTFLFSLSLAQDFSMDQLKQLVDTNGKLYLQPLATAYGTAMNTGLYNTAKTHKLLGFDIQLKTGLGLAPASKTSETNYQFDFSALPNIPLTVEGFSIVLDPDEVFSDKTTPNIIGGKAREFTVNRSYIETQLYNKIHTQDPTLTHDQINSRISGMSAKISAAIDANVNMKSIPGLKSIKGLEDLKTIPFPFPILQASIGLPFGLEPSIRLIPAFKVPGDIGKALGEISVFGAGLKVDLDQFIPIPLFPVDIAVQAYFQKMNIGELLSGTTTSFNLMTSKTILFLTPYLGVGKESSSFTASYKMDDGSKQDFKVKGKNNIRMTAGLNIKLLILQFNAEYSKGEYDAVGLGVGFALR
ncbi:MAG: DUF6588 family protein [Candidatus Neomarinimicrobiota bacterium]